MPQYYKLLRKIRAGARWVIPQLGYDMRKFHEIKLLLASRGMADDPGHRQRLPADTGRGQALQQRQVGGLRGQRRVAGQCEKYAAGPDKGQAFFRELAAKQLAVFRGLGFAAGYLGGIAKRRPSARSSTWPRATRPTIGASSSRKSSSRSPTSSSSSSTIPRPAWEAPIASIRSSSPRWPVRRNRKRSRSTTGCRASCMRLAFTPRPRASRRDAAALSPLGQEARHLWPRWSTALERASKHALYGCQDCGDCSLPECAYLCPRYSCSKCGRNGPCGGSADGRCELGDKECLWARIYERLKSYGQSQTMLDGPLAFHNAELDRTSSWANFYLQRDHTAEKK